MRPKDFILPIFVGMLLVCCFGTVAAQTTDTIYASSESGGTISPSGTVIVTAGDTSTFTITPAANYYISNVVVDGGSVGPVSSYTFPSVSRNHTIIASFYTNTYTITAIADLNGSITPSGTISVTQGGSQSFSISASAGYHIQNVFVNGVSVGADSSYAFTNVQQNDTIHATFAIDTLNVTATAGPNGVIYPSGLTKVIYGDSLHLSIVPNGGYHVLSITDGVTSEPADTEYQLNGITASHTISVLFQQDSVTITTSTNGNGTISPSGSVRVASNSSPIFTITPSLHYQIDSLIVDGSLFASNVHTPMLDTLKNVIASHTIQALFGLSYDTVLATAEGAGTITPSGQLVVQGGTTPSFTMTPDSNSVLVDVIVDGSSIGPVSSDSFPNISANHTITAVFNTSIDTIIASSDTNGTISPSGTILVSYGVNKTFTMTPKAGYHIVTVVVDGDSLGPLGSYEFTDVTKSHTIRAHFAINTFMIVIDTTSGGTASPTGPIMADSGSTLVITFLPDAGYHVAGVAVNDTPESAGNSYTLANIHSNDTLSVTFAVMKDTIRSTAGPDGNVSPAGTNVYNWGANDTVHFIPNPGYHVDSVIVDAVLKYVDTGYVGGTAYYFFDSIKANHSLRVSFSNTYTIRASVVGQGSISPSGAVSVIQDSNQVFTMKAATGYHLLSVKLDTVTGPFKGAGPNNFDTSASDTFFIVSANAKIIATFAIDTFHIVASPGANGTITPAGTDTVLFDSCKTFKIIPESGYHVVDVMEDTIEVIGADTTTTDTITRSDTYTICNVAANHSISATFAQNLYVIVSISGGGTVSQVPDLVRYPYGDSVKLSAVSASGYFFSGWSGDTTTSDSNITIFEHKTWHLTANFSVLPLYQIKYRTATYLDWWSAKDGYGYQRPVQRIVNKYEFQFDTTSPAAIENFLVLYFGVTASGFVSHYGQNDTLGTYNGITDTIKFRPPLNGPVRISVHGWYFKGARPKVAYSWNGGNEQRIMTFDYLVGGLPIPDLLNVLVEMYPAVYPAGLLLGVPVGQRGASSILLRSYALVEQSIGKGMVKHDTTFSCLQNRIQLGDLSPAVDKDGLFANLLVLRLNSAASLIGKFPTGLGQLTYTDVSNPANGLTVDEIGSLGDSVLSCVPTSTHITNEEMYQLLFKINGAFADTGGTTPIDTVSFSKSTILLGIRSLVGVPFLRYTPGVVPPKIGAAPTAFLNPIPSQYSLEQNYPNPFNPTTSIEFNLPFTSFVTLKVYNVLGEEVATLINHEEFNDGSQRVQFDASKFASGVYFYRLTAQGSGEKGSLQTYTDIKKMMLIK